MSDYACPSCGTALAVDDDGRLPPWCKSCGRDLPRHRLQPVAPQAMPGFAGFPPGPVAVPNSGGLPPWVGQSMAPHAPVPVAPTAFANSAPIPSVPNTSSLGVPSSAAPRQDPHNPFMVGEPRFAAEAARLFGRDTTPSTTPLAPLSEPRPHTPIFDPTTSTVPGTVAVGLPPISLGQSIGIPAGSPAHNPFLSQRQVPNPFHTSAVNPANAPDLPVIADDSLEKEWDDRFSAHNLMVGLGLAAYGLLRESINKLPEHLQRELDQHAFVLDIMEVLGVMGIAGGIALFISGLAIKSRRNWGWKLAYSCAGLQILSGLGFFVAFLELGNTETLEGASMRVHWMAQNIDFLIGFVDGGGLLYFLFRYRQSLYERRRKQLRQRRF